MPNDVHMKIEHFVPRSVDPDAILEWSNLLGCCAGRYHDGQGRVVEHCDSHRTPHARLNVHPVRCTPEDHFVVNVSAKNGSRLGEVTPKTSAAEHDLRELNLNAPRLVENRRGVVQELRAKLAALGSDAKVRKFIRDRLATASKATTLPAHAHVAVAYLERKRRAHGS